MIRRFGQSSSICGVSKASSALRTKSRPGQRNRFFAVCIGIVEAPRVASPGYLDGIGAAAAKLERALGGHGSPFAEAMKVGMGAAEELAAEVERGYKVTLA